MIEILSEEEISITIGQAYTNSKLSLIDFSMLERDKAVAQAQRLADLRSFVKWLDDGTERIDADGDLVISLSSYQELKKLAEG